MEKPYRYRRNPDDEPREEWQSATAMDIIKILSIPFAVVIGMSAAILLYAWIFEWH